MSVVIAIKEKNNVILGCDKQATCGHLIEATETKISEIKNYPHGLIGSVGYQRNKQLIFAEEHLIDERQKRTIFELYK